MSVSLDQIKELRTLTGAGVNNVKEALEKSNGDTEKAVIYLREKGLAKASKRADKTVANGYVASYMHSNGMMGVMVQLNSETDFTARNEKFRELANQLAVQLAAAGAAYISIEDIPEELLEKEKSIASKGVDKKKPKEIQEKILQGKLSKFYEEVVLLEQVYVKDESKKVKDLLNEAIAAIGEKIEIGSFSRIQIKGQSCSCGF